MELQDSADLDSFFAKPLGLRLDVVDVDRGDTGFVLLGRRALGDRDLHLAALEPRPAPLLVEVGLLEAELFGVEDARRLQVSHLVPDLDGAHSIKPGSSRNALTVRRKSAAVAPSRVRWSQVSVIVISGRASKPPSSVGTAF